MIGTVGYCFQLAGVLFFFSKMRLQRSPCGVMLKVMVVFFIKVGLTNTGLMNTEFGVFAAQDFTMSEDHIAHFEENMQMLMLELDVEKLKEGLWSHQ